MGKIQVGQKNPKTVDMGGFTVVTNPTLEETSDVLRAKEVKELFSGSPGKERELEGSFDYADDDTDKKVIETGDTKEEVEEPADEASVDKEASTENERKVEDKEESPVVAKEVKSKKNQKA